MAEIIPFPTARRRDLVWHTAVRFAAAPNDKRARVLNRACNIQRAAMERRQLPEDLIARDLDGFRDAVKYYAACAPLFSHDGDVAS